MRHIKNIEHTLIIKRDEIIELLKMDNCNSYEVRMNEDDDLIIEWNTQEVEL